MVAQCFCTERKKVSQYFFRYWLSAFFVVRPLLQSKIRLKRVFFLDIRINFWYKVKSYQQIGEIRRGSKNNNEKKYHNKQQKVYF